MGTKPKVVTEELQPKVVYQKDNTKEKGLENETIPGKKGSKVTTTTYTLNKENGQVTENVGTPVITNPTNTIIKVPAKDKVVYQKDGNNITKVTTTYTVDEATGKITEKSTTETFKNDGLKPKVTTEVIPVTTTYTEDITKEAKTSETANPGKEGKIVTTTPYILNEKDGTVKEGTPTVDRTEMIQKVVKVGTKPKVVTEELQPKVVYQKDDTKEKGLENETIPGKKGSKVTTTTYTLNKETGKVTENVGTPVVTNPTNTIVKVPAKDKVVYQKDGNDIVKVITTYTVDENTGKISETSTTELFKKDGLKPKVTTEVIPVTTKEEKDDSKVVGTTETVNPGKEGKIVTTTPYILNEKDGTVKEGTPTVEKTEMIQKVVKVGTHPASEVPNEAPSVDVPEFNGGVNPNEAPSVDVPEFNGDSTKEEDKSKDTKNKNKNEKSLPNTGMASGSIMTLLGGLSLASGLGLSRKKKED